jgi:hypothetical protein
MRELYGLSAETADSQAAWNGWAVLVRRLLPWLAMMVALCWGGSAGAATQVQVLETFPSGATVTLGRNEQFYLHLHYETDRPAHIWARPYFQGREINAGSNPSQVYPAGSGEALGWFFLFDPGQQVDEVRISAGDGSSGGTSVVATWPVRVTQGDRPAAGTTSSPAWVTRLKARDAAADRAAYEKAMNTPPSPGEMLLLNGFMLAVLGLGALGIVAPAWGLWRWRGGWRLAAALPAAAIAFVVLRLIVDLAGDPTSHNLWPFEILQVSLTSVAVMAVLLIARRLTGTTT